MEKENNPLLLPAAIIMAGVIIALGIVYQPQSSVRVVKEAPLKEKFELPVIWNNLGRQLVEAGVIDGERFKKLYIGEEEYDKLLNSNNLGKLEITRENAELLLNLFWALGLASKNEILEKGEMANPKYGGAGNFASTGGWTIVKGNAMDHYSSHKFFNLTPEQQALVDKVSRGIYRPCCGNSTHFPDCNHGMAMLGLLELMASQGISEQKMWETALAVNSYWFPDAYLAIAQYFESRGISWEKVNPKEILGAAYSSASGYQKIMEQVKSRPNQGGGGCSV